MNKVLESWLFIVIAKMCSGILIRSAYTDYSQIESCICDVNDVKCPAEIDIIGNIFDSNVLSIVYERINLQDNNIVNKCNLGIAVCNIIATAASTASVDAVATAASTASVDAIATSTSTAAVDYTITVTLADTATFTDRDFIQIPEGSNSGIGLTSTKSTFYISESGTFPNNTLYLATSSTTKVRTIMPSYSTAGLTTSMSSTEAFQPIQTNTATASMSQRTFAFSPTTPTKTTFTNFLTPSSSALVLVPSMTWKESSYFTHTTTSTASVNQWITPTTTTMTSQSVTVSSSSDSNNFTPPLRHNSSITTLMSPLSSVSHLVPSLTESSYFTLTTGTTPLVSQWTTPSTTTAPSKPFLEDNVLLIFVICIAVFVLICIIILIIFIFYFRRKTSRLKREVREPFTS